MKPRMDPPTSEYVAFMRDESRFAKADGKLALAAKFACVADRLEAFHGFVDSLSNPNIVHMLQMHGGTVAPLREAHIRHMYPDLVKPNTDGHRSTTDSQIIDALFKEGVFVCLSHDDRFAVSVEKLAAMYGNALELERFESSEMPGSEVLTLRRTFQPERGLD